ncbi:MAG: ABC transporter permease subunit [Treponema sp.]|nr:ABC transporter permease subunit [Treponema sp.]
MEKNNSESEGKKSGAKDAFVFFLGIILIGCLIQIAGKVKGDALVFPSVPEILAAFIRLVRTPKTYHLIFTSLLHLSEAMIFSTLAGISIGIAEGMCPFLRKLLSPMMIMMRSIPMIVLVVIIMILTKYSRVPHTAATLILIPLISEAASEGCQRIDRELIDVYRLNSDFSPRILFSVYIPLMAGYLKQAYINAVGMGMKLIVSTEYLVQTKNSLGKEVYSSSYFNEYQDIYAYAIIMILLVVLMTKAPFWIMRQIAKKTQKSILNKEKSQPEEAARKNQSAKFS